MLAVVKQYAVDAGFGVGQPQEATEPFPTFIDRDRTLAHVLNQHQTMVIGMVQQKLTSINIDVNAAAHVRAEETLMYSDTRARTVAWLDNTQPAKRFDEVLFFDTDHPVDSDMLESLNFFNGDTLAHEQLVGASIVFCLPNKECLYDRAAIQAFIRHEPKEVMYWGPEVRSLPQAVGCTDPFYSIPSYTSTKKEEDFSHEDKMLEENEEALSTACGGIQYDCDEDEDEDSESEASICCVTALAHDKAMAKRKIHPRIDQSDVLPFRRTFLWVPPKYVNKKRGPPPAIIVFHSDEMRTVPIVRPLKSFQGQAPRIDKSAALRAMRANIRDASIIWPTYAENFSQIQHLPPPRMQARPPRPNAGMLQPVHPEVKAQRETAKPLYLTVIHTRPDALPARHFALEASPDSLGSLDLLRLSSATGSVQSIHSLQADLVLAPLQIDTKGIHPPPGPYTIQPADPNIRAQWKHVSSHSYHQRHDAKRQRSSVELNARGELTLVNVLEERQSRTPLVLKPFRFLRKLLRAAMQERD